MNDPPADQGEGLSILDALQGIKTIQHEIRHGWTACTGELLRYYRALPENVQQRLTELQPRSLELVELSPGGIPPERICQKLSSDAAFEQVLRAVNGYRTRDGLLPLGPDGWPIKEETT